MKHGRKYLRLVKNESPTKAEKEEGRGPEKEKRWRVGFPIP